MSNSKFQKPSPPTLFWLCALLVTLFSMALEWGGMRGEGVIDDHAWLHDPEQRGCSQNAWECFQHPQLLYYYRPLLAVTFVLGKRWYHLPPGSNLNEAFPFHVENLIYHGLVVLLVFWLLRLLFRRDLPAVLGGTLFALHPLHVPVTTFIGGRTDNLALIFLALFAIGLLKIGETEDGRRKTEEEKSEDGRAEDSIHHPDPIPNSPHLPMDSTLPSSVFRLPPSPLPSTYLPSPTSPLPASLLWLLLSLVAFTAALFTKEQCVLLVVLAPLLLTLHQNRNGDEAKAPNTEHQASSGEPEGRTPNTERSTLNTQRSTLNAQHSTLLWLSIYLVPIALYGFKARQVAPSTFFSPAHWSLALQVEMIGRTCWYYACAFLFPTVSRMHQSTLGPWDWAALGPMGRTAPNVPAPPSILLAVGGFAALLFTLWLLRRTWRHRACRFCLLWLLLTLLPCLNIIPVPSQFIAPYRAVIPLVGVCGAMGVFFAHLLGSLNADSARALLFNKTRPMLAVGLLIALCDVYVSVTRADVPQWHDDMTLMIAEMSADINFVPARGGEAYVFHQRGELTRALQSYDTLLHQLLPEAHNADEIIRAGRAPDMPRRIASASSLRYNNIPYLPSTLKVRGGLDIALGLWNDAVEDYRAARALDPTDNSLGDWMAYACDRAGRLGEEETVLKTQLARHVDSYRLSQLGSLYFRQGRWKEARDTLLEAMQAPASDAGSITNHRLMQQQYNAAVAHISASPLPR